jgi:hypothetical protein
MHTRVHIRVPVAGGEEGSIVVGVQSIFNTDDLYLGILAKAVKHYNEIFQDIKYQQLPADIKEARAITTVDPLRFLNGTQRLFQRRL